MAIGIIPTRTDLGAYTFQSTLDSIVYRFSLQFNTREGFWYLSIFDSSGTAIRSGIKVVVNWPLLARAVEEAAPLGRLFAFDPRDIPEDPGLTDLGDSAELVYAEEGTL